MLPKSTNTDIAKSNGQGSRQSQMRTRVLPRPSGRGSQFAANANTPTSVTKDNCYDVAEANVSSCVTKVLKLKAQTELTRLPFIKSSHMNASQTNSCAFCSWNQRTNVISRTVQEISELIKSLTKVK